MYSILYDHFWPFQNATPIFTLPNICTSKASDIEGSFTKTPQKKNAWNFGAIFCPPPLGGLFVFHFKWFGKRKGFQQLYTPAVWISAPGIPGFFLGPTIILRLHFGNFGWVGKLSIESHQMVNLPLKYPAKIHSSRWRMLTIFGGMKFHPRFVPTKNIRNWKLYWPSLAKRQLFLCQIIFSVLFLNQWFTLQDQRSHGQLLEYKRVFFYSSPRKAGKTPTLRNV